jgi:alpha-tubulin suppressor-like RCC1 family protein
MFLASCSQEDTVGPRLASLEVVSGGGQNGPIGGVLANPFVIKVVDQGGTPVSGAVVNWSVTSGGGLVTPNSVTTGSDGLASTTLRLGSSVGVQTVSATLGTLTPVSFTATATAAPASKLVLSDGDGQVGAVGAALTKEVVVKVSDAFDNPQAGVPVNFLVTAGGGSLSTASTISDASGLASVRWTLGTTAGTQTMVAGTGSLPAVVVNATAQPGAAAQIVTVSGANQSAPPGTPLPDSLVVRVVDQYGNGIAGDTVRWTVAPNNGTLSPSLSITNSTGRAATKFTLGTNGGPKPVTVTSGALTATVTTAGFIVFEQITAGGRSACATDQGGVLYCWGFNGDAQLGIGEGPAGSGPVYAFPQAVAIIGNQTFGQVNGGRYHNCAVTFSHVGYCWGDNNNGQIGIGTNTRFVTEPQVISVSIPFATISAGRAHSCGISIGGRPYCWGSNERGQLGGSVDTTGGTVLLRDASAPQLVGSLTDGKFFGAFNFRAIAAGGIHTCAIDFFQQAFCWGMGLNGQLGDGTNVFNQYQPQPVVGGTPFDSITAGYSHSCALASDGAAWCWGNNADGQLGDGSVQSSNVPVRVTGGLTFVALTAGYAHTCGIAADGTAWCWGRNEFGQLGDGTTTSRTSPTPVAGELVFKVLSAGDQQTCGVTVSRVAACWGDNEYGSLGDGTQIDRLVPTKVAFQP